MLKLSNNKMSDDNPDKDIYNADNSIRQLAIRILEEVADVYGNPDLFDKDGNEEPDGTWYIYEDLVTGLILEALK